MIFGFSLTQQEKNVLVEVLYNKKEAIVFSFKEMDMLKLDVAPLQEIWTIPYKA